MVISIAEKHFSFIVLLDPHFIIFDCKVKLDKLLGLAQLI